VYRTIADLGSHVADRYTYESRFANVNGWRIHYIDEGPRDARPVLLLHGNPAWGYLWRDTIPPLLAAGYRVVAPDQIGFGLSEHPHTPSAHSLDNHAANLVSLLDQLDLKGTFFVCHDWGGPTGLSALLTRQDRASAVAVMSTWAWREPSSEFHKGIMPWKTLHAPIVGPYLMGRQGAFPGRSMYLSVVDRERCLTDAVGAYDSVQPDAGDRRLTWQWPRSIPINPETDITGDRFEWLEAGLRRLKLPSTVIWGQEEVVFTADVFAPHWHEVWPHAEGTHLVTGNHFLQEDSGAEVGDILVEFGLRQAPPNGDRS
jgi:haloalkane dehalogenase